MCEPRSTAAWTHSKKLLLITYIMSTQVRRLTRDAAIAAGCNDGLCIAVHVWVDWYFINDYAAHSDALVREPRATRTLMY